MLTQQQSITRPFGITVFGSAVKRVPPDIAVIGAAASSIEQKPVDAFSKARSSARSVQDYLRKTRVAEFGMSRIQLLRQFRFANGSNQFAGYQARISFRIRLAELDRVDEIVDGLVTAGANEIERLAFETTKLREMRAQARRMAVEAALEKAQNYCAAAGVGLGNVLHIEDANPLQVQGQEGHMARGLSSQSYSGPLESDGDTLDPSLIEIAAAVIVSYDIVGSEAAK